MGDELSVRCPGTPLGDITIEGSFKDKRGMFWNIIDYELKPTVALAARIRIVVDGEVIYDTQHEFHYTAGD